MNCFVAQIDLRIASKLETELREKGFEISRPPYTLFSAKKSGISCTLYASGKLTVQGKDKDDFIRYYLEPEILHTFTYAAKDEAPPLLLDKTARIGVDEAGKGDFFGPLCIAAVYADEEAIQKLSELGVRDSKTMSDSTIRKLAPQIKRLCLHKIIALFPQKYNQLYASFHNLNSLLAWGHATAIEDLVARSSCRKVIIDQFADERVVENALKRKGLEVDLTQRHRGEEDLVVATASMLARAAFVEGIDALSREMGISLPKGAANHVTEVGKELFARGGMEALEKAAKLHFKTTQQIIPNRNS